MSGRRWQLHLDRIFKREKHHKIKRINNPGEVVVRFFFIICALALAAGLATVLVSFLSGPPEFHPPAADGAGR